MNIPANSDGNDSGRRVTFTEVACLAGVSQATVSRVFNANKRTSIDMGISE